MNFADDKTILNMLSVNRRMRTYFEQIFKNKYPLLIEYKRKEESLKKFYLSMIYYISKLEKELNMPYIHSENFNPKIFYLDYKFRGRYAHYHYLDIAIKLQDIELIRYFVDQGVLYMDSLKKAVETNNPDIVKLISYGIDNIY